MTKRLFDLVVSASLLVLMAPILVAIALVVRLRMGTPVLFSQLRPGRHGQPFRLIKFRTMITAERAPDGRAYSDAERLPRFGQILRSTSLDELPELWNVLKGEMSLVGPRPLLMQYLPLYSQEQARRHEALPGITGWAQVNGRNSLSWEEKFALDVYYVDHQSFWLDLVIIGRTVARVLTRDGITRDGHATTEFFQGTGR